MKIGSFWKGFAAALLPMVLVSIVACSAAQRGAMLDLADGACVALSVFTESENARTVCAKASELRPFVEESLKVLDRYQASPGGERPEVCVPAPSPTAFESMPEPAK